MGPDAGTALPVVGRVRERQALSAALDAALAGTGSVVLVTGPAGIGKTRVLEMLADDAQAAAVPVRWGRGLAEAAAAPLWPWRTVLPPAAASAVSDAAALGRLGRGTPQDAAVARLSMAAAVVDALLAEAAPAGLVIVLEDLHWADTASLALLRHLAAEVRRSRLLVVGSCRDAPAGPLADTFADLVPLPGVEVLELTPLSVAGVAAYLSATAGRTIDRVAVTLVHELSGGNPLYVRTIARVLGADLLGGVPVPDDVARRLAGSSHLRSLVAAVLRPLDEPVRHLLGVASVLGEHVDPALLAAVAERPLSAVEPALDAAAAAGLLAPVPDTPGLRRFVHALVRDGVRADLPDADRRRWHARAASVLEPLATEQPHRSGEVAFHWLQGATAPEQLRRAVAWSRTAAAQAAVVAPEEATRLLGAALSAAGRAGTPEAERAELLVELATAEYRAGRMAASLERSRAAADAAERAGRPDLAADAALVLSGVGHTSTAAVLLELSDRALGATQRPAATARLLAQRSLALAELGHVEPARAGARAALAAAEACSDSRAVLASLHSRVDTLDCLSDPQERRALAARALEVASAAGQPLARLWARLWLLDAAYQSGDPAAVEEEIARIEALAGTTRLPLARWHLLRVQASRAAFLGRLEQARTANEQAGALAAHLQDASARGMTSAFRSCMARLTGDPAELGEDWLAGLSDAPDLPVLTAGIASAMLLMDRPDEAALHYQRVLPLVPGLPRDGRWRGTMEALVEVVEGLGDAAAAATLLELLLPAAAWSGGAGAGNMWVSGSGWRQVARMAGVAGRREQAVTAYEQALAVDGAIGARPDAVHVRLGLAELLVHDDTARSLRLASEAAAEARRLGLPGPLRRADSLLAALARVAPDPLSPREREVAELVAQSRSNREVARQLVLSERTVESHVRSILAKLGLTRRTDIVRWVLGDRAP